MWREELSATGEKYVMQLIMESKLPTASELITDLLIATIDNTSNTTMYMAVRVPPMKM